MRFWDSLRGLVNDLSGLGGIRDKGANSVWTFTPLDRTQLDSAYRSNWMARKAVDIPAFDMLREGWTWEADKDDIGKLEEVEREHKVQLKILAAQTLGRLYGGGAIYMSDGNDSEQPLRVVKAGDLKFMSVLTRWELQSDQLNPNPVDETYLEPVMYTVNSQTTGSIRVHPSRIVRFYGNSIPKQNSTYDDLWSDSILEAVDQAIRDATSGQQGIAQLIQEAKIDVIKLKGLMNSVSNVKYRQAIIERNALAMQTKSMTNALMLDGEDTWEQKQVSFQGLPDVMRLMVQIVSGAADIPATRFLGQSPQGMSATGESDMRNYYDRIGSDQELKLRPSQQKVMDAVAVSALGKKSDYLWFKYNPLWQMTEKEQSEITKSNADSAKVYVDTGLLPKQVLEKAVVNQMIESGMWPGLETAMEEFEKANGPIEFTTDPLDPSYEPPEPAPVVAANANARKASVVNDQQFADASPRSLYVWRSVTNAADIVAHYKRQGVIGMQDEGELHVTVMYSRTPVDWMKAGQDYWNEKGTLTVPPGGPRVMSRFDGGAIVLEFSCASLSWRWLDIKQRTGAEPSHPEYSPHITIAYDDGAREDVDNIEPYVGKIEFGPEMFATVNEGWKEGL